MAHLSPIDVRFASVAHTPWGAEHSLQQIVTGLSEHGLTCSLVACSRDVIDFFGTTPFTHTQFVAAPANRVGRYTRIASHLRSAQAARATVAFSLDLAPLSLSPSMRARLPNLVLDLHDAPRKLRTRKVLATCAKRFERVICISEYVQSLVPFDNVSIVERPIISTPTRRTRESTGLVVGIAGRLDPEKRIELAIDAVEPLAEASLRIFGGAFADQRYSDFVLGYAESRLGSRFTYRGVVPEQEIYSDIDVLIVSNPEEPSGRTVGEAMAAGLPVLVPDRGGASEYVTAESTGLVYRAGSSRDASHQLCRLLDPELRQTLGEAAAATMRATRSPEVVLPKYIAALGLGA